MKSSVVILAVVLAAASCASPGKSGRTFVVVQDVPAWAPGRTELLRQVIFWEDGRVQDVRLEDRRVTRLNEFVSETHFRALPSLDQLNALGETYAAPVQPGVVAEGRSDRTVVVVSQPDRAKFIHADNVRAPQAVQALRHMLPTGSSASGGLAPGGYIAAKLLNDATAAYVQSGVVSMVTPETMRDFPGLDEAIASPFKFTHFPRLQWDQLRQRFNWKANAGVIKVPSGRIMYLEYYG